MNYETKLIVLCLLWLIAALLMTVDRIAPHRTSRSDTALSSVILVAAIVLTWHMAFTYWL